MTETFHSGEREIQKRTGEELIAQSLERMIMPFIPDNAAFFIERQSICVVSSIDNTGNIWTTMLIGSQGFANVIDSKTIVLDRTQLYTPSSDIFFKNTGDESVPIGSIFIELETRRRFRTNGMVRVKKDTVEIMVNEAYGNCPKYIQKRAIKLPEEPKTSSCNSYFGSSLNDTLKNIIHTSDTLFIGSVSGNQKMDASHRGGNPGFVETKEDSLIIPDYRGNSLYNTLGNIHQNKQSGLVFIDFEEGCMLQLTGTSKIIMHQNSEDDIRKTGGTGRYLVFKIERWIYTIPNLSLIHI